MPSGAKIESFLLPWDESDKAMHDQQRSATDQALIIIAQQQNIRKNASDLVLRDTLPGTDLQINNGGTAPAYLENWTIPAALTAGTEATYFNPTMPNYRAVGFYSVGSPAANPSITRIKFSFGNSIVAVFQTELLFLQEQPYGYLNTYQAVLPDQPVTCSVMPKLSVAASTEPLTFGARTVEPVGQFLTNGVS